MNALPLLSAILALPGICQGYVTMEPVEIEEKPPPPERLSPLPGTPSLGDGLGCACERLDALFGQLYRFAPGQQAARDAFHQALLANHPTAARRQLPADIARAASRCDAPAVRLCEEGLWLAHYRGRVVAPFTGRFRFMAVGDARVSVLFQRQRVLHEGKSEAFSVTEGHSYPVEIIISGGKACTLLIEDLDGNPQAGKESPRYDLFRCHPDARAAKDMPTADDAPVWLTESYFFSRGVEPVRE